MRKSIVGNGMGAQAVTFMTLALVLLAAVSPSFAQTPSDWSFVPLQLDFAKFGGTHSLAGDDAVDAILFAEDSNGNIQPNRDGAIRDSGAGAILFDEEGVTNPIIANIEQGERLKIFAIIQGVDDATVAGVADGDADAVNAVKDSVTTSINANFFAPDGGPGVLHPTRVEPVPEGYGIDPAGKVIVWWEQEELAVTASSSHNDHHSGMSAAVNISGGDSGSSNLAGIEVGNTGPSLYRDIKDSIRIRKAWDTTTLLARYGADRLPSLDPEEDEFGPLGYPNNQLLSMDPAVAGFQFRASDIIQIEFDIRVNANLDGEPDDYFSTAGDQIVIGDIHAETGVDEGTGISWNLESLVNIINIEALVDDLGVVEYTANASTGDITITVTTLVDNIVTFGPHLPFDVSLLVSDDAGKSQLLTTAGTDAEGGLIDTVEPAVTGIAMIPEYAGTALYDRFVAAGIEDRNKISVAGDRNQVQAVLDVYPGGESFSEFEEWLNIWFWSAPENVLWNSETDREATDRRLGVNFRDVLLSPLQVLGDEITASWQPAQVLGFTSPSAAGVEATITLDNDLPVTVADAGVVVVVSDDARNFARVLYDDPGADTVTEGVVLENATVNISSVMSYWALNKLNTDAEDNILFGTLGVEPDSLSVDNNPPVVLSAELSVIGMPGDYFPDGGEHPEIFGLLLDTDEAVDNSLLRGAQGSKLQVVVNFDPADGNGQDLDQIIPAGVDPVDYLMNAFSFGFTSADMGYAGTEPWVAVDAELVNPNSAFITLEQRTGIPAVVASLEAADLDVQAFDLGLNGSATLDSSDIILDDDAPEFQGAPVVQVWDVSNAFTFANVCDFDLSDPDLEDNVPELESVRGPDELIEAGDVIVIQAVVVEDAANPLFALYGGEHAFPYETLFEDAFSTLTADFSSIVEGAVGVVPNCVFNLTKNSNDLSDTDPGDEIQVTWFYKIGSENLVGGAGVRSVELVARDPSGNITREEVPVGEVDFAEPEVDIRAFAISIPARGITNATFQTSGDYSNFGTANAYEISAATASTGSTLTLVVDVSEGPFLSPAVTADFSAFGGPADLGPTATNPSSIAGAETFTATFTYTVTSGEVAQDTPQARVKVTAYKDNGVQLTEETSPVQVDRQAPKVLDIIVQELDPGYSDILNDFILRPGQPIAVTAEVEINTYEDSTNILPNIDVTANFSVFGTAADAAVKPTSGPDAVSGNIYRYIWLYTVKDQFVGPKQLIIDATDVVGNVRDDIPGPETGVLDNALFFMETDAPAIVNAQLFIKQDIDLFGGTKNEAGDWELIEADTHNPAAGAYEVVGASDLVRIVVSFDPQDQLFTDPESFSARADFSILTGDNDVVANSVSRSGILMYATFEQEVSSAVASATNAYVTVTIADPSGLSSRITTVDVGLDSIAPLVALDAQFFQNGEPTDVITDVASAHADIVVSATYGDKIPYPFVDVPAAVLRALTADDEDVTAAELNQIFIKNLMAIDFSALNPDVPNPVPNSWSISNPGFVSSTDDLEDIVAANGIVVTATWTGLAITSTSVQNARIIASASDTLGNVGTNFDEDVLLDDAPPVVENLVLQLASSAVPYQDYIPGIFAGDVIVRPTRISTGTPLEMSFRVEERPNPIENGTWAIYKSEFGAGTTTGVFPPNDVTHSFTVGNANSTFPIVASNALQNFNYANVASLANVIVEATDDRGNDGTYLSSAAFEVDTQGPVVGTFTTSNTFTYAGRVALLNSIEEVQNVSLETLPPEVGLVNAQPGQWIIWAATVVVDGDDVVDGEFIHFQDFDVDFEGVLGAQRIVTTNSGYEVVVSSATRAILFATEAVQISNQSLALNPITVPVTMVDALGNVTETMTPPIAINAQGPRATELVLTVNGVNRNMPGVGLGDLGIGDNDFDADAASFEVAPNSSIVIEATITSVIVDNVPAIPSNITLDLSPLYPSQMKDSVDEVVPTSVQIQPSGLVYAKWERILSRNIVGNPNQAVFADADLVGATTTNNANGAVFTGSAPTSVNQNSIVPIENEDDQLSNDQLNSISGLPFIQVQDSAAATKAANLTVTVADSSSPFVEQKTVSSTFAIDTQNPRAWYSINVLDRALEPIDETDGFPNTIHPNNAPLRVRGGDTIQVVVRLDNPLIDFSGDDRFRNLLGDLDPFSLANDEDLLSVTADLAEFNPDQPNAVATFGVDGINTVEYTAVDGEPSEITATFQTTVSSTVGDAVLTSTVIRNVTPVIMDDAFNVPQNTPFITSLFRETDLAVDNTPPAISGSLEVVDLDTGEPIDDGAVLSPNQVIGVTVTISDLVDNPLNILDNVNFGSPTLVVQGFPQAQVDLLSSQARLTGSNSIEVPFRVIMPDASGFSANDFSFIISATDVIGNSASVTSIDEFDFDARPAVTISGQNGGIISVGETMVLTASAFDVGGIEVLSWEVPTISGITFSTVPEDPDFSIEPGGAQEASFDLAIDIDSTVEVTSFEVIASATDVDGNFTEVSVVLTVNTPAIFAEVFNSTATTAAGEITAATIESTVPGWNQAAGIDVRSATVSEGGTLVVDLVASDLEGEIVTIAYAVSSLPGGSLELVENGFYRFTYEPGYALVLGEDESEDVQVTFIARDESLITPDYVTLNITVLATPSEPTIAISSVSVNGVIQEDVDFGDSVEIPEGQTLEIVVVGTDPGMEDIELIVNTIPEGVEFDVESSAVPGAVTGTVSFTPPFDFADNPDFLNPLDPFIFEFRVDNGINQDSGLLTVDVINAIQGPIISTTATVTSATESMEFVIDDGDEIEATAGNTVTFNILSVDPDGNAIDSVDVDAISEVSVTTSESTVPLSPSRVETVFTVNIPDDTPEESTIDVVVTATNDASVSTTEIYTIVVKSAVPVTPDPDELVIAQGYGGTTQVNVRNFDPNRPDSAITSINRAFPAIPEAISRHWRGNDRDTKIALGDLNGDGVRDLVMAFGPVTQPTVEGYFNHPNIIVVRELQGINPVLGRSFQPFSELSYPTGDLNIAVGDFKGAGYDQIAVAQGIGGDNIVRIWEYTGEEDPDSGFFFSPIESFTALAGPAATNNASGGVHLAAGDLDGDGRDELVISQTYSATSLTQFQVVSFDSDGRIVQEDGVVRRVNSAAFPANFRTLDMSDEQRGDNPVDGAGARFAICDIDGDGDNELLAAADGPGVAQIVNGELRQKNLINIIVPIVEDGQLTGFNNKLNGGIFNAFNIDENPSGSVSVAGGEFNLDLTDGCELAVGTNAIYTIDEDGNVIVNDPAPQSRYRLMDVDSSEVDGNMVITAPTNVLNYPRIWSAYVEGFNPTSGAVNLAAGNVD